MSSRDQDGKFIRNAISVNAKEILLDKLDIFLSESGCYDKISKISSIIDFIKFNVKEKSFRQTALTYHFILFAFQTREDPLKSTDLTIFRNIFFELLS